MTVTAGAVRTLLSISREHPGDSGRTCAPPCRARPSRPSSTSTPTPASRGSSSARSADRTSLPILLKGILHPDDARRALDLGVSGIIVSNHGGRQVDGAIASLDALPALREAVGAGTPLVLDSGVRTGSDVVKALALGADAVTLGRPYIYGLALAGAAGVRDVVANVIAELDLTPRPVRRRLGRRALPRPAAPRRAPPGSGTW